MLSTLDYMIIGTYVVFALAVGSYFSKKASSGMTSFFVGDRKLPWWLAGTSIVATTFAADTPLAVTGIVAADGISGNWIWWCWAIAHLTATFFFARLWQRSGVITDAEITELRYSGAPAAWLRGFKAIYFGIFINCLTMAWVIAAMVKISQAFFPTLEPATVIFFCILVSVTYTSLGGFRGVVITDLIQFGLGMLGAIALAFYALRPLGGIGSLPSSDDETGSGMLGALAQAEGIERVHHVLDFLPAADHPKIPLVYFVVLLIAGWWRYAEGNGYIVQRLAACKDEHASQGASLWFATAHNALRPWPWILVGLVSLVVYPRFASETPAQLSAEIKQTHLDGSDATPQFTLAPASLDVVTGGELTIHGKLPSNTCTLTIGEQSAALISQDAGATVSFRGFRKGGSYTAHLLCRDGSGQSILSATFSKFRLTLGDREMGYPLIMRESLPTGLLGLVIASLLAAFMSTIDTHTNWGSSYLVNDIYRRFLRPREDERHYVWVSRACILLMAVLAGLSALMIHNIASVWRFLITLGAGLGSVSAARWYWHRVTPHAEFAAMGITTFLALALEMFCTKSLFGGPNPFFLFEISGWQKIITVAAASLLTWIPVSLFGPRNDTDILQSFAERVRPPGPGWGPFRTKQSEPLGRNILGFFLGLVVVFGTLFGIGEILLGNPMVGGTCVALSFFALISVIKSAKRSSSPKRSLHNAP